MAAIAAGALLAGAAAAQLGRTGPPSAANPLARNPAAVDAGQRRFQQLCTGCHGRSGEGGQGEGQGPNLVNSWEVRRASDAELFASLRNGIKGTAMPAFPLPDTQIWELAAFVRSLNAPADSVPVPGDPAGGEAVFFGQGGCSGCHSIRGRGGYLGPDLSDLGATRRLSEIRDAILKPGALSPDGYRAVRLSTADGWSLRGVVKHVSNWSLEVLDERGVLHLLHGAEMRGVQFENKSWMPDDYARRLSPDAVRDLVAFLSRQSMRPPGQTSAPPRRTREEQAN